jgi:hypothetical protein
VTLNHFFSRDFLASKPIVFLKHELPRKRLHNASDSICDSWDLARMERVKPRNRPRSQLESRANSLST